VVLAEAAKVARRWVAGMFVLLLLLPLVEVWPFVSAIGPSCAKLLVGAMLACFSVWNRV